MSASISQSATDGDIIRDFAKPLGSSRLFQIMGAEFKLPFSTVANSLYMMLSEALLRRIIFTVLYGQY